MRNTLTLVAATLLLTASAYADGPATPASSAALLPSERTWLTPLESGAYDAKITAAAGNAAGIAKAVTDARAGVKQNLPADARTKYAKLTTGKIDEVSLNDLLYNVVNLTPAEVAYFEQKNPASLKKYQAAIAALQSPDGTVPIENREAAHKVVLQYRAMTAAPATRRTGTGAPVDTHRHTGTPGSTKAHAAALTAREIAWLSDAEASDYAAAIKKPGLKAADRLALLKKNRDALAGTDLPAEFRDGYKVKIAESAPAEKIDAFLLTIVELSPAELADLEKIVKGKEPAGLTLTKDNARLEYVGEMAPLPKEAGHVTPKQCRQAYAITAKYRGLLKQVGSKAPTDPASATPTTGATGRLSDKEYGLLTPDEKKAYDAELAAAAKTVPPSTDGVNLKYRRLAATRDIDVFTSLDPNVKKDLCAPYKDYIAGNGTPSGNAPSACDPAQIDISKCKQPGKQPDRKCIEDLTKACQTAHPQTATPSSTALAPLDPKVQAACAALNQSLTPPTGGNTGPIVGDVPPPARQAGTDKDPKAKDEKKGFFDSLSKEMSSNIKAGVAGAVFGLLLGSFFGPVGMVVGAAIGGAAFFGGNMVANKLP